jgi:hypothetical protein
MKLVLGATLYSCVNKYPPYHVDCLRTIGQQPKIKYRAKIKPNLPLPLALMSALSAMVRFSRFRSWSMDFITFVTFDSIFVNAIFTFFGATWSGLAFYFLYTSAIKIDHDIHRAPTNCTVLSAMAASESWQIHVNYPVPGQSGIFTALLGSANVNDMYTVNQTLLCFYSTRDFHSVVQFDNGADAISIVALLVACLLSIVGVAGALYVILVVMYFLYLFLGLIWRRIGGIVVGYPQKVFDSFVKHIANSQKESASSTRKNFFLTTVSHYMAIPAKYYQVAVGGIRTWIQERKPQSSDAYDMEEQATLISHGHSNCDDGGEDEDKQTKERLDFTDQSDHEDWHSEGNSTLFDR